MNVPIRVVHLGLGAQQLLLTGLVGKMSSHLIAVLFRLKEGDQMDTGPDFLARELATERTLDADSVKKMSTAGFHGP